MLAIIPNRADATSFYRGIGPLAQLRKQVPDLDIVWAETVDWAVVSMVDMVFMQRPFDSAHRKVAELCNQFKIPLWVDYDDLLFDVPPSNPAHGFYMQQRVKEDVIAITRMATVVTVSTHQLKRCLQVPKSPLNQRIYVVPNALPDYLVEKKKPYNFKKQINWRGTNTHHMDILQYGAEIVEIANENPDCTFTWIGDNPWMVTNLMKENQSVVVPPMNIGEYFDFILETNPPTQIVPLDHCMFNLCKSNIAWIEATLSGSVVIAPKWEEWDRPGVLNFGGQPEFKAQMNRALKYPDVMAEMNAQSWEYIRNNLLLSRVNETRAQIVQACEAMRWGKDVYWPAFGAPETILELA